MKFYIEFNPCKECKEMIREIKEGLPTEDTSQKFLRHLTYNHGEIGQAIIDEFPKEEEKEHFPWFQ